MGRKKLLQALTDLPNEKVREIESEEESVHTSKLSQYQYAALRAAIRRVDPRKVKVGDLWVDENGNIKCWDGQDWKPTSASLPTKTKNAGERRISLGDYVRVDGDTGKLVGADGPEDALGILSSIDVETETTDIQNFGEAKVRSVPGRTVYKGHVQLHAPSVEYGFHPGTILEFEIDPKNIPQDRTVNASTDNPLFT